MFYIGEYVYHPHVKYFWLIMNTLKNVEMMLHILFLIKVIYSSTVNIAALYFLQTLLLKSYQIF